MFDYAFLQRKLEYPLNNLNLYLESVVTKIKTVLNTILFLTGEVKVIKLIKYLSITLSLIGLALSTAYAAPKKLDLFI